METDYTYDTLSDLLSVTQWGGPSGSSGARTRSFSYDSLGRLLSAANPETGSVGYTYDASGNLLTKTDARSITATSAYDTLNRVLYHSFSDGTPTACFQYDVAAVSGTTSDLIGQLTGEWTQPGACPSGPVSQIPSAAITAEAYLQYDSMGRAKLEKFCTPQSCNYGTSVSALYDLAGNLTSLTYPDGRIATQSFDPGARLSGVNFTGTSYLSVNSYDAPGHLTSSTLGNGTAVAATYNPRLEITSLAYGPSASPIWSRQYAWTPNGNLQQAVNLVAGTTRQYGYDTLNRLTSALDVNYGTQNPTPGGLSETYGDDPFGNMEMSGNFTFMPGTYTSTNQLPGWSYDASGDLRQDALGNSYTWDANGMTSSADGINYSYDAEGNRVGKSGSGATDTVYFGGRPIARLQGGPWTDLVYGAGGLLAEFSSGPVYRMIDPLGSEVGVLSSTGGMVGNIQDYAPYGELFNGSSTTDPFKFTGKEQDTETGNDYFVARYYGSSMGRFLSPDDGTDQDPTDPQSWNLYGYVRNNPLINTDPNGHDCVNASHAANGIISVQATNDSHACLGGYTYVNGTVDTNSPVTYSNGQVGFILLNYGDGSGTAGSVTMTVGNQADPDTLKAGVFGSPSAQTWTNALGAVNTAGAAVLTGASVVAPELLLEDTEIMGGLGLEMEATQNLEIVAADGTKITGYTEHGMMRASGNGPAGTPGVRAGTKPQAILDALKNPKSIQSGVDQFGRPFKNFIGQDAKVTVNPSTGKIVSVNPLSGAGAR